MHVYVYIFIINKYINSLNIHRHRDIEYTYIIYMKVYIILCAYSSHMRKNICNFLLEMLI